jgi:hypothetical protein
LTRPHEVCRKQADGSRDFVCSSCGVLKVHVERVLLFNFYWAKVTFMVTFITEV